MDAPRDPFRLIIKSLIAAAAVVVIVLVIFKLLSLLVLVFAAVVAGTLIRALADAIAAHSPLGDSPSFYAALLLIVAVIGGLGWFFGAQLQNDFTRLSGTLTQTWQSLEGSIASFPGGDKIVASLKSGSFSGDEVVPRLSSALSSLATAVTDTVLFLFGAVFIASDPGLYRRGLLMLFPRSKRDLAGEALCEAGASLRLWMLGQFISMTFIGVATGLVLWLVGVPSASVLGLIAGFLEIIPYLGPILAAVPILAMAAGEGQQTLLLALVAMVGIQQLEGSLVTPFIHKKVVSLPPAVSVFGVVAGGILFGPIGLLFAAPLLIVVFVLIKRLYVEETLHTPVNVPGRDG